MTNSVENYKWADMADEELCEIDYVDEAANNDVEEENGWIQPNRKAKEKKKYVTSEKAKEYELQYKIEGLVETFAQQKVIDLQEKEGYKFATVIKFQSGREIYRSNIFTFLTVPVLNKWGDTILFRKLISSNKNKQPLQTKKELPKEQYIVPTCNDFDVLTDDVC